MQIEDKVITWLESNNYRCQGGEIKNKNNQTLKINRVWHELLEYLPDNEVISMDKLREIVQVVSVTQEEESQTDFKYPTCETVQDLVKQAIRHYELDVCQKGENINDGLKTVTMEVLLSKITLYAYDYAQDSKGPDGKPVREIWPLNIVKSAVVSYLCDVDSQNRALLRKKMQYEEYPEMNSVLDELLERMGCSGNKELAREVLKQWIWQVKRYLYWLEVPDPLFINIMSPHQHIGKSFIANRLCEPIGEYAVLGNLAEFGDMREVTKWLNNYVIKFDELSVGKAMENGTTMGQLCTAMKQILTARDITARNLGHNSHMTGRRLFSAIGTSNDSLVQVVYDSTGMRRFFELVFTKVRSGENIEFIEKINFEKIWKGIDHEIEKGYVNPQNEMGALLTEVQATYQKISRPLKYAMENMDVVSSGLSPVLRTENGVMGILNRSIQKGKLMDLKDFPYDSVNINYFRKKLIRWISTYINSASTAYIPYGENLISQLRALGYAIAFNNLLIHQIEE